MKELLSKKFIEFQESNCYLMGRRCWAGTCAGTAALRSILDILSPIGD